MRRRSGRHHQATAWLMRVLAGLAGLVAAAALHAASIADAQRSEAAARFFDPGDGWFDVSGFLDTAYGFVPLLVPITEPAVGFGAAGAHQFAPDRSAARVKADSDIAALSGGRRSSGTAALRSSTCSRARSRSCTA